MMDQFDRDADKALACESGLECFRGRPAKRRAEWLDLVGRQTLAKRPIDRGEVRLQRDLAPDRGDDAAARFERAVHLSHGGAPVGEKLETLLASDDIERFIVDLE